MLTATLRPHEVLGPWRAEAGGWTCGGSQIRPVVGLRCQAWTSSTRTVLLVAPGGGGHLRPADPLQRSDAELAELVDQLGRNDDDQVLMELGGADPHRPVVRLVAGVGTAAPLYLSSDHRGLHASWDLTSHYPRARQQDLDLVLAAHYLVGTPPYSRRTLLAPVQHLTERATAWWRPDRSMVDHAPGALTVQYPPSAPDISPAPLRAGADPVRAFGAGLSELLVELLGAYVDPWSLELSGGADSAVLLVGAAGCRAPLRTYGLVVSGLRGRCQRQRRDELVCRFGGTDRTLEAYRHPALDPHGVRLAGRYAFGPHEEIYTEAFDALLRLVVDDGARRLVTGTGGDELFLPHFDELTGADRRAARRTSAPPLPDYLTAQALQCYGDTRFSADHAPRTVAPRSTLASLASRAPVFLRQQVLPVNPFAHPAVVTFCRRLPPSWRQGNALARQYLRQHGCSDASADPQVHESFQPLFDASLRGPARPLLEQLFAAPILSELGLVDGVRLAAAYRRYVEQGAPPATHRFYQVAALELMLRTLPG